MAKPGAGKLAMQRVRKKQSDRVSRDLKKTAKIFGVGKKRKKKGLLEKLFS